MHELDELRREFEGKLEKQKQNYEKKIEDIEQANIEVAD
jgi:hypothetical protein